MGLLPPKICTCLNNTEWLRRVDTRHLSDDSAESSLEFLISLNPRLVGKFMKTSNGAMLELKICFERKTGISGGWSSFSRSYAIYISNEDLQEPKTRFPAFPFLVFRLSFKQKKKRTLPRITNSPNYSGDVLEIIKKSFRNRDVQGKFQEFDIFALLSSAQHDQI